MPEKPPFPPASRLVAYCRDSGGREQDVSVDRQKAEILAWAHDFDLTVTHWFEDRARSGGSTQRRDAFLELTDYLSESDRPEAGVVIWEYARFARQFDDAMFYVASLRRLGYQVYSITDAIPDTLEGRLLESILAWKNAKYREDLSRAVRSGMRLVVSSFKGYPNHKPPLGYKKDYIEIGRRRDGTPHCTARLIPDPETAPLVQQAFELRAGGATYAEIHNALHLTAWHISLNKVLDNPIYTGTLRFGGQEYPGFCAPLVSAETWARAQVVNCARAGKFGYDHPRRSRSRFLLTGLLFCGLCGNSMNARIAKRPGQKDVLYYVCRDARNGKAAHCHAPGIPKQEIEKKVLDQTSEFLQHPDLFQQLLKRSARTKTKTNRGKGLDRARADLSQNEKELRHVLEAVRAAGHSKVLLEELGRLEKKHDSLAVQIEALEAAAPRPIDLSTDDLAHGLQLLANKLSSENPTDVLTVLRGLVVEIHARREGGTPQRHQHGEITGQITLRVPASKEEITVPL